MPKPIGLQLYTLRRAFRADPTGTLTRVREIGYDAVEFATPLGQDFAALGRHLRALGLDCPSAHAGIADLRARPSEVMRMAEALGCRTIVLPYLLPEERDWSAVIADLQVFARAAQAAGFATAYHHHEFEMVGGPGTRPFDRLVAETDPALVTFELDTYWLAAGGEDPVAMLRHLAGRVRHLHLKDRAADGTFADVGAGTLDFPAILAAAASAGVEHLIVEHDNPPDSGWASVTASLAAVRALG